MPETGLLFRPALELAALVRAGDLSARELVEASLERIDALNPELNVFVDVFHDEALAAADGYDVVVAPALAEAPVLLDAVHWQTDDPMGLFTRSAAFTPFTAVANVTGQPAVSVPIHEHEGLPVAAQLFGRPAAEGTLLAVARQLEAARPWVDRRPPVA